MVMLARPRRSVLYMPGSNAKALAKAKTLPADALILDLEDSVAQDQKVADRNRTCIVGAPGAPCFCESNVLSGASCGSTPAGAPLGAPCDGKTTPCQSALSCNSGICEDRDGRCPY